MNSNNNIRNGEGSLIFDCAELSSEKEGNFMDAI